MKNLLIGIVAGLASLNATARTFDVRAEKTDNNIQIHLSTVAQYTSMCTMSPTVLRLVAPKKDISRLPHDDRQDRPGAIEAQVLVNYQRPCLMAHGPHYGTINLLGGFEVAALPNLEIGKYYLSINGERYGALVVKSDTVTLQK